MTEQIRKFMHAAPFVPFLVKTSDGKQYRVKHPDYVSVGPKGGFIVIFDDEDLASYLSARHIVAVEPQRRRSKAS